MNPLSAIILVFLIGGAVSLPRKWAVVCMIIGVLFLSQEATLTIANLNFLPNRLLSYFCFLRVIVKGEFAWDQLTKVDRILGILYLFITAILLTRPTANPLLTFANLADAIFTYFAFRGLIKTPDEFRWILGVFAFLLIPFVMILAVERTTRHNLFQLLGASAKSWIREDKIRCFGSFRHPSLLGSVGACFFPLFAGLALDVNERKRAIIGATLCVGIVGFSNSGGPLSVLILAIIGWGLWGLRTKMKLVRRTLLAMIILAAMLMKAPIWFILARISGSTGGTGWHRAFLIDQAVRNIDKWWLVGMPVIETKRWFPYVIGPTGGADITNAFIEVGLNGGILAVLIFIFLIVSGFSLVGRAMNRLRWTGGVLRDEALMWGLGVTLASHVANWLGITYWDQFNVLWFLQLAALVSLSDYYIRRPATHIDMTDQIDENIVSPVGLSKGSSLVSRLLKKHRDVIAN